MTGHSSALWFRTYRQRILDGLEHCRQCGRADDPRNWVTFDHIIPKSAGANLTFANATLLCEDCQLDKGDSRWPHLVSLADEEASAPRDRQWALHAQIASFRASDDLRKIAQRGLDACAVSVHRHHILGMLCVRCPLHRPADVPFLDDVAGLAAHLDLHRAAGQHVPDWVFEDLAQAKSCQTVGS